MPIGNPDPGLGTALPFGHQDVVIPIKLGTEWGINSKRRRELHVEIYRVKPEGVRITLVDDDVEKILIRAQGLPQKIDQFRVNLMGINVEKLMKLDGEPRTYNFPAGRRA
jgi:predicted PilT family ATPase